ncbi:hypothetical protein GA0070558_111123 [Micromonospora haikouensis]|uniref:Uncharacterized protein n=1 Tax=Micromonospora haikouensis TaxID=686309 RepID=A0A1C4VVP8_9ACTN|nr:hypothetical protein [Micromonospora haikouensis]SCE87905.1 hypothetical protein GA0070558_111123 [Micromonospora haikouensis]
MRNLPNSAHPSWCLRGPDCAVSGGLHLSGLVDAAVRGDEVLQVRLGLWRIDTGPTPPSGLLLELSAAADVERWPIDLAQSRSLVDLSGRLLAGLDSEATRAA